MANQSDWGLTELGFRRPSYAELLVAYEYQAREKFQREDGTTPDLTVRSPLGMFLRIWAWITDKLFQLLEDVYNSQFVDTSVGASLYQLGRNIGLKLLPSQRSSGYEKVSGTPGVAVPAGFLVGTIAGIQFAVQLAGTIGADGTVTVPIQCTELGTIGNVARNTITQIVTPLERIEAVTNESDTDGGRGRETDEQFRDRYYRSVDFAGGVNADAIQAEILQTVEGVLAARVYENDTDFEDARGLPPHSIEAVVYSGLDYAVAQAIYRRKAAGIQTHGSSVVEIISPQSGQIYQMRFTRPAGISVWIRLEAVQTDSAAFPADGAERIVAALVDYIGSDITGGLNIGEDVIYNKLPCRVFSVPGVIDFTMAIGMDGINFSRDNIVIDEREKAVTSAAWISVALAASSGGEGTP